MLDVIDKNSKTALSVQVSEKLIASIRGGLLTPGKRMPGIRLLSKKFGTSHSTIIEALNMLGKQNYIERIPGKGTFVADDIGHELNLTKLVFPFPESAIGPQIGLENWETVSAFYRGMLTQAINLHAEISFLHFDEAKTEVSLSRQLRRLNDFDGGIFVGEQLDHLFNGLIAKNKPCVALSSWLYADAASVFEDVNESFNNISSLLSERGYKKLRILSHAKPEANLADDANKKYKIDIAIQTAKAKGIIAGHAMVYNLKDNSDSAIDVLFAKLMPGLKDRQEAFFAIDADTIPPVYRFAAKKNLKIGSDFGIFGFASGITFNNLDPEVTYSKINHFEMGKMACRMIVEAVNGGDWRGKKIAIPNTLIIKQSI
ncbi:MAG: GntR family transcriptional regulator [Lentisphaerota bacterium]